jgi:hypothetical protein
MNGTRNQNDRPFYLQRRVNNTSRPCGRCEVLQGPRFTISQENAGKVSVNTYRPAGALPYRLPFAHLPCVKIYLCKHDVGTMRLSVPDSTVCLMRVSLKYSRDSPGVGAYDICLAIDIPKRRRIVPLEVEMHRLRPGLRIEWILRLEDHLTHRLATELLQSVVEAIGNSHYPIAMHHCLACHHLQA